MKANKITTEKSGATTPTAAEEELLEQYWTTMARTADLVRKLTSLADRYDATIEDGDPHAADRRRRVALMRRTAESGRRLIRSLAPPPLAAGDMPAPSVPQRADGARSRDAERDIPVRRIAGDENPELPDRFFAACDRDAATTDRGDALAGRRAAKLDRDRTAAASALDVDSQPQSYALVARLDECAVVRQAQGLLMARSGVTAGEAFETLLTATGVLTLEDVAEHVVRRGQLPAAPDAT